MANHLTLRHGTFHARLDIPKDVRAALGNKTSFRKSLRTGDKRKATALAAECVTRWKYQIEEARGSMGYMEEAQALRRQLLTASDNERDQIFDYVSERAEEIEAQGTLDKRHPDREVRLKTNRSEDALKFYGLATGKTTPVKQYIENWLSELHVGEKTKAEYERAVKDLEGHFEFLQQVTRRTAGVNRKSW